MTPEELLRLDAPSFKKVVERDSFNDLDGETATMLRSPLVIDRFVATLTAMHRDAESLLAARKADYQAKKAASLAQGRQARQGWLQEERKYHEQRAKTLRFKSLLEKDLIEAKRVQAELADTQRTSQLEEAIRRHRDTVDAEDATDSDFELWSFLDDGAPRP